MSRLWAAVAGGRAPWSLSALFDGGGRFVRNAERRRFSIGFGRKRRAR